MRIRLNLATKALETQRRFVVGAGLLAAIAGIAFLILGWHLHSVRKADSEFRAQTSVRRFSIPSSMRAALIGR